MAHQVDFDPLLVATVCLFWSLVNLGKAGSVVRKKQQSKCNDFVHLPSNNSEKTDVKGIEHTYSSLLPVKASSKPRMPSQLVRVLIPGNYLDCYV